MNDPIIIKLEHARQLGYCSKGMRRLCEKYGLDYLDFIKNGISAEKLLSITNNDWMVQQVVEVARGVK